MQGNGLTEARTMAKMLREMTILGCGLALAANAASLAAQDLVEPDAAEWQALEAGEESAPVPPQPTRVLSERDAQRLRGLEGMSLQWIGWGRERGEVSTTVDGAGVWRIYGEQVGEPFQSVVIDGTITEIGPDYFIMTGAVTIANAPDAGRTCEGYGSWRFAVTQNRKYYRLRQFEWCDGLTDYIDLYF
jgi:hypothetical protein